MDEVLLSENRRGMLWLTLNRQQARNALDRTLANRLRSAFDAASDDGRVRAIVLTAAGDNAFCAGADLKENDGRIFDSAAGSNPIADVMRAMRGCRKLVIGRINGTVLAGGLGLVAACDLAYAADDVRFGLPEVKVGVFPFMVSTLLLRQIPQRRLAEMAYLGTTLTAAEAETHGLINAALPRAQLDSHLDGIFATLRQNAPSAIVAGKQALGELSDMDISEGLARAEELIAQTGASEEAREGRKAFAEKRKPNWAQEDENLQ